jgi:hypothetical protein
MSQKNKGKKTEEETVVSSSPDVERIKAELGKLYFIRWIFVGGSLASIILPILNVYSYSAVLVLLLSTLLLLIVSFKDINKAVKIEKMFGAKNPSGESAVIVFASLFFVSGLSILLASITYGIKVILGF